MVVTTSDSQEDERPVTSDWQCSSDRQASGHGPTTRRSGLPRRIGANADFENGLPMRKDCTERRDACQILYALTTKQMSMASVQVATPYAV